MGRRALLRLSLRSRATASFYTPMNLEGCEVVHFLGRLLPVSALNSAPSCVAPHARCFASFDQNQPPRMRRA